MAKRKETLEIEEILRQMCKKRRIYGCEEVTIGFYNNGHGNEIVDFCTMDSKGTLRCYEIKVTLADLKSKAKKSWYGHYNYLFVTRELYQKICERPEEFTPDYVGIAIPCPNSWSDGVEIVKNPKKQELSPEQEVMLKESMVRSMSYKMQKLRDAADIDSISKLQGELRKSEKERTQWMEEATNFRFLMGKIERILRLYYGKRDVDVQELVTEVAHRSRLLPEKITLFLTERGREYNKQVAERGKELFEE